jgi:hypothetical protein
MFKSTLEAPEVEVARLAEAPEGSRNHVLSTLPVNITHGLHEALVELPPVTMDGHTVVVVPTSRYVAPSDLNQTPTKRHRGSYDCIIVASTHPSYPAGGWHLSVPEAQLVRGRIRTLAD